MKMSRSLNAKASSIGESGKNRKEIYDKKHAVKPRGQSGTHRLKNLNSTPDVVLDLEIETKK